MYFYLLISTFLVLTLDVVATSLGLASTKLADFLCPGFPGELTAVFRTF